MGKHGKSGDGICCETGNEKALAEGVLQIMKEDLEEMGNKSLDYCRKHFDKKTLMDVMDGYLK